MTNDGRVGIFGTGRGTHHPGDGDATFRAGQAVVAALIAIVCLAVAGCAAARTRASVERQTIIDQIVGATAKVVVEQSGRRISSGSGVVVASMAGEPGNGAVSYVLTAAHILDGKDGAEVFVRFTGTYGLRGKFAATVFHRGNAETLDLALLKVPGISVPAAVFPADDHVRIGEEILVVGFPWGKRLGLFSGIVSQVPTDADGNLPADEGPEHTIVVDATSAKGVSGGGVFREATGSLVGIVEGYQTASIAVKDRAQTYSVKVPMPGETFVVPVTRIRHFLDEAGLGGESGEGKRDEDRKD
jgi:serine protease Do